MTGTSGVTERNAYMLAELAECAAPDGPQSLGAALLLAVWDGVRDAWAYDRAQDAADVARDVANSAVPVHTHGGWATFAELSAWRELDSDPGDYGLADAAAAALAASESYRVPMIALYGIADRLARTLWAQLEAAARLPGPQNSRPAAEPGRVHPVCQFCGATGWDIPAAGPADPWALPHGWAVAPYPPEHMHPDGSTGSLYTCAACAEALADGQALAVMTDRA